MYGLSPRPRGDGKLDEEHIRLLDEVARLRAALQKIAESPVWDDDDDHVKIARKALGETVKEGPDQPFPLSMRNIRPNNLGQSPRIFVRRERG